MLRGWGRFGCGLSWRSAHKLETGQKASVGAFGVLVKFLSAKSTPESHDTLLKNFNMDMNPLCIKGDVEACERIMEQVRAAGLQPDVTMWTSMMNAHATNGNSGACERVMGDMKEARLKPDMKMWNTLMKSYAMNGDVPGCRNVMARIAEADMQLNLRTWGKLMNAAAKTADATVSCDLLLTEMLKKGLTPDVPTWTTAMGAHAVKGDFAACERVVLDMRAAKHEP